MIQTQPEQEVQMEKVPAEPSIDLIEEELKSLHKEILENADGHQNQAENQKLQYQDQIRQLQAQIQQQEHDLRSINDQISEQEGNQNSLFSTLQESIAHNKSTEQQLFNLQAADEIISSFNSDDDLTKLVEFEILRTQTTISEIFEIDKKSSTLKDKILNIKTKLEASEVQTALLVGKIEQSTRELQDSQIKTNQISERFNGLCQTFQILKINITSFNEQDLNNTLRQINDLKCQYDKVTKQITDYQTKISQLVKQKESRLIEINELRIKTKINAIGVCAQAQILRIIRDLKSQLQRNIEQENFNTQLQIQKKDQLSQQNQGLEDQLEKLKKLPILQRRRSPLVLLESRKGVMAIIVIFFGIISLLQIYV